MCTLQITVHMYCVLCWCHVQSIVLCIICYPAYMARDEHKTGGERMPRPCRNSWQLWLGLDAMHVAEHRVKYLTVVHYLRYARPRKDTYSLYRKLALQPTVMTQTMASQPASDHEPTFMDAVAAHKIRASESRDRFTACTQGTEHKAQRHS